MIKGYKIFAALIALTLCMGANLYAERARSVGVQSNGDLDLSAHRDSGLNVNLGNGTIAGQPIQRTGPMTARTADGKEVWVQDDGNRVKVHYDGRVISFYANGSVPTTDPETYSELRPQALSVTNPESGMPMHVTGTVKIKDFREVKGAPQETPAQSNEYDIRKAGYENGLRQLRASGVPSLTVNIGGVAFTNYANGVALFDPSLPEKLAKMDPAVVSLAKDAQMFMPPQKMFTVQDGRLLYANGAVKADRNVK